VALRGDHGGHLEKEGAVLARAPLAGGSPREVLENVSWADWDAKGELAVAHRVENRDRLEYPIGHVLYQTAGWISHMRIAPQGDKIAFLNHPIPWDDRGSVALIDEKGNFTELSTGWESEDGLAWSSDGKEIWFTAVEKGGNRELLAVTPSARMRKILALPAGMTLEDVAPDGRALVSLDAERMAMVTMERNGKPMDISWHDWTIPRDISADGQSVLFEDSSESAGNQYSLAIRKIDGTLPVQLGTGSGGGLSPDGKWAISIVSGSPGQVTLVPIGPGQPRIIPTPSFEHIYSGIARFLADGKHITLNASEHSHGQRCYLLDFNGSKPIPISPEGVTGALVSPDLQHVIRTDDEGVLAMYPIAGGPAHVIPNLEAGFTPLRWSDDGSTIFGYTPGPIPTKVYKVDVSTGKKSMIQQLQPERPSGAVAIRPVVVSHDGSRFAYGSYEVISVLYLISGLR
jgi:eukaryotic-like serine/threonine-protein kinase